MFALKIIVVICFIILLNMRFDIFSRLALYFYKLKLKLELYKKKKGL